MKISNEIKESFELNEELFYEMANLTKKKSGLTVDIWADHRGIERKVSHRNSPRVKLGRDGVKIEVTISKKPKIIFYPPGMKLSDIKRNFADGIAYVAKNSDLFLKHYMDIDDTFDDEDLYAALRKRGMYK